MSAGRPSLAHRQNVLNNRVQRSMEGWSVIEKIADFTHAVCRVADGSGSAILVSLPFADNAGRCKGGGMGVLLTTTFVLSSREKAQGAAVKFLEQPIAGTSARQGRNVEPIYAPLRPENVFFCSTFDSSPLVQPLKRASMARASLCRLQQQVFCDADSVGVSHDLEDTHSDTISKKRGVLKETIGDEEEELGYTLTFCDMNFQSDGSVPCGSTNGSFSATKRQVVSDSNDMNNSLQLLSSCLFHASSPVASLPSESNYMRGSGFASFASRNSNSYGHGSQNRRTASALKPLPLPLLLHRIAPVQVGDCHMMITHINGLERHYVVQTVKHIWDDLWEYEFCDPASDFSSGGPIFDMNGDFVGLQHQSGDHSYGICISSIVRHLFQSKMLGLCRLPIVDVNSSEEKFDMNAVVPDDVFNQPFHINQQYCVLNVGAGDQIIEYEDFERLRLRSNVRSSTQPLSLVPADSVSVWREFYSDFNSIVLILHAFSHAPKLTIRALDEMTSRDHREKLQNAASVGAIGIILEIIDGYPQNEEVLLSAFTVLANASLYQLNRSAIFCCDGVVTLLEIMNECSHHASIQHWGFCCLYNLMSADSPSRAETIQLFAENQGIALAIEALRFHSRDRHVLRNTGLALSCVASKDAAHMHAMVSGGLVNVMVEQMKNNSDDSFVFFGLATLLREMLVHVMREEENLSQDIDRQIEKETEKALLCGSFTRLTPSATVSKASTTLDGLGRVLLDVLIQNNIFALLITVVEGESSNTHSSASVSLLESCINCIFVLMLCRIQDLEVERELINLKATCERIVRNFPNERDLLQQVGKIMEML